jgi:hypothetical protein
MLSKYNKNIFQAITGKKIESNCSGRQPRYSRTTREKWEEGMGFFG